MCGIAGFVDFRGRVNDPEDVLTRMGNALSHRGPDDSGIWMDGVNGIGFVHRRLSIVDLSSEGHQPMRSTSGRYVIVFNGEIYNFQVLRAELEASSVTFRGHSDTEVLLAAIEFWGLSTALDRSIGMFAFALWDRSERQLHLGRDRLGKKPLYFGFQRGLLIFASELKAIEQASCFQLVVNRNVLGLYLRLGYVPAPHSIYNAVSKVLPGQLVSIGMNGQCAKQRYWQPRLIAERAHDGEQPATAEEVLERLEPLLMDAVALRMIADVPLGAFLSGGIDSSLIVALMQRQSHHRVKTFTVGFAEDGFNEAAHAREVALHLETDHTEIYLDTRDARAVIPELPRIYDEPFADVSQIPTYLVSRLARQSVTVVLSGDGGDEAFGGYNRYTLGLLVWRRLSKLPMPVRRLIATTIARVPVRYWNSLIYCLQRRLPSSHGIVQPGEKIHKLATIMLARTLDEYYGRVVSSCLDTMPLVIGADGDNTTLNWPPGEPMPGDPINQMILHDVESYLPDDILVKVDRASMAVSLEARAPLLDHRVVEFGLGLPGHLKVRGAQGKVPLRQLLARYVPEHLFDRPKAGFAVPLADWLRTDLRDWAESLLARDRLESEGYLRPDTIRSAWTQHLSGRASNEHSLWSVLTFQAWLERRTADSMSGAAAGNLRDVIS